jgi:triosephosphate isomerase
MRKKIIAGNWKMNILPSKTSELINLLKDADNDKVDVVYCIPFVDLQTAILSTKNTKIKIGAQNAHFEDKGAFTGEISFDMLVDLGVTYCIIGHSERREYFNETDEAINKKLLKAFEKNIIPILCVGENLDLRNKGTYKEFIKNQLILDFKSIPEQNAKKVIIAYEPIWAIGTGLAATSAQAEEICAFIRNTIKELYNENVSEEIRIQYGGSVNGSNAKELFSMTNIDGALVGGASLKEDFINIIKSAI